MAIPKINEQDILKALKYIDEHGVPIQNESTKYELVTKNGKKYPPKYVIAIADHLANGSKIAVDGFNAVEAKNFFENRGYTVHSKFEKFELIITADGIKSTDERFSMDDLGAGDNYKPLDAYFKKADETIIKRSYNKGERRNTNQTMARIAFQVFEKQIVGLSVEDRENFPVCRYNENGTVYRGIFTSIEEFKNYKNTIEYLVYAYDNGRKFFIYCWNIFSTILFVQECLKRFGKPGDQFVLLYREKEEKESEKEKTEVAISEVLVQEFKGYRNPYSSMLIESKNVIFRGAPGTGKSYLAKEIATDIISNGYFDQFTMLTEEQRNQVEFVQFHPSYDYTDFVEGLRPKLNDDGSMGFELKDGVFKKFVQRARKNYEDFQKPKEVIEKELSAQNMIEEYLEDLDLDSNDAEKLKTIRGREFYITSYDDKYINVTIPENETAKTLSIYRENIQKMLESSMRFEKAKDVTEFFGKRFGTQENSYELPIYHAIKSRKMQKPIVNVKPVELKKYVFIIDEINRGEISKIFGELFFSIDPGYRGESGEVSTQYVNLHENPEEKFFIPDNVYIIGTMNDIDRSVDSFDFAMRRRFRFIELRADENLEMLSTLDDEELQAEAIRRMSTLNKVIASVEDLNENYQIGASYFLKLKTLNFDQLWTDYLQPLLQDYVHGMYDEKGIMERFAKAYGYVRPEDGSVDEAAQD